MATVTPAYGRDYKNKAQIAADLLAGKDFVLQGFDGSGYIDREALASRGATVNVRYARMTKVAVLPTDLAKLAKIAIKLAAEPVKRSKVKPCPALGHMPCERDEEGSCVACGGEGSP